MKGSRSQARADGRPSRRLVRLAAGAVCVAVSVRAGAQSLPDSVAARVDAVFAPMATDSTPGCAVGVYRDGAIIYAHGYGMADLGHHLPITPSTVFYIGSTSKQFTAMMVSLLIDAGRVRLDESIRNRFPELPAFYQPVTVDALFHHTSGVRDYLSLWDLSGRDFADAIPEAQFLDLMRRQRRLNFTPGTASLYSNSGYALLALLVKRVSGMPVSRFADSAMFRPLGMSASRYFDDRTRIVPDRAMGYYQDHGHVRQFTTSFDMVGDGGVLTNVEDLQKWDENFYHNVLGSGGPGLIDEMLTRGVLANGDTLPYARGLAPGQWRGWPVVRHSGSFLGFHAELLRLPSRHVSVATLCNSYALPAWDDADSVAAIVVGRTGYVAPAPAPVGGAADRPPTVPAASSAEALDSLTGLYWGATHDDYLELQMREGRLAIVHGPALEETARWIFRRAGPAAPAATLTFRAAPGGPPRARLVNGGDTLDYARAVRAHPTAAQLDAYVGTYDSEELDTWFTVTRRGDSLFVRRRWREPDALEPTMRDRFRSPVVGSLRFERAAGTPVRLVVSAGRVRDLVFTRRTTR